MLKEKKKKNITLDRWLKAIDKHHELLERIMMRSFQGFSNK
jgi:hypothetical protein